MLVVGVFTNVTELAATKCPHWVDNVRENGSSP